MKDLGARLPVARQAAIVAKIKCLSSREVEISLAKEQVRSANEGELRVQIILTRDQMRKLERVRELTSHSNFGATLAEIIDVIADDFLLRKDPLRREVKTRTRCETGKLPQGDAAGVKPSLRNVVFRKTHGACEYRDPASGRTCGSRYRLQIDHIKPKALGGGNEIKNLRALYQPDNLLMAERVFRRKKISEF